MSKKDKMNQGTDSSEKSEKMDSTTNDDKSSTGRDKIQTRRRIAKRIKK